MLESWLLTREATPTSERLLQPAQWYSHPSTRQAETKATLDIIERCLLPNNDNNNHHHPHQHNGPWQQGQQEGEASRQRQRPEPQAGFAFGSSYTADVAGLQRKCDPHGFDRVTKS